MAVLSSHLCGNGARLMIFSALLCGCTGPNYPTKISSQAFVHGLGVRDQGLNELERHFSQGLSRLYDRWYLRHAQNSATIPALIILFTKFENVTELPLTSDDLETFCQSAAHLQRRFRLHCAIDHSEEEIGLELERLRNESHQYKAERDEEIHCVLARAELTEEPGQNERLGRTFRLHISWQNSHTLAEVDEVDERVQLNSQH